jgi:hypothetical protein
MGLYYLEKQIQYGALSKNMEITSCTPTPF